MQIAQGIAKHETEVTQPMEATQDRHPKLDSSVPSASPVGAVAVVGGGIAGMQSALDLANAGYYVYLVEKSTAIGGLMSQLDKTFPTNDCAM
jgi:heterodisulfide reductase subunit A